MTQLLLVVGIFVFFISVYGAVMIGGHLLAELEARDDAERPTVHDSTESTAPDDEQLVDRSPSTV